MTKPIPALDESGEFVEAKLRDGGTATVYAFANCQVHGNLRGTAAYWEDDGIFILGMESDSDIINLPEIRATVERARKMREASVDYGLQFTPMNAIPSTPARPTFAEALEREANLLYEAGVAIHGSERPETNVYRALIKAVERARRASGE